MVAIVTRNVRTAVLIPSRGRPDILAKTLKKMPFLNDRHTYIGVENQEVPAYIRAIDTVLLATGMRARLLRVVSYDNPDGSVGIAREQLRLRIVDEAYDWCVATDDNARYTQESLTALVQSAESWQHHTGRPTFVCGMHSTAPHFDRTLIKKKEVVDGWTTYPGINFIFHAIPHGWYEKYSYPPGCFALEDRHMMLAAINAGMTEFRVSMDAPYAKSRYQPGGQGDITKRRWNCGRSIEQLAHDFPLDVGVRGTLPLPWQMIRALHAGAVVDRLMGGAMRKGDVILRGQSAERKKKPMRARIGQRIRHNGA